MMRGLLLYPALALVLALPLLAGLPHRADRGEPTTMVARPHANEVAAVRTKGDANATSHRAEMERYLEDCRRHGVPVPGPIAVDPLWSLPIDLSADASRYLVLPGSRNIKAWTYRAANGGFCVAFLRDLPGEAQPQIGTICSDAAQLQACFFDNLTYGEDDVPVRLGEAATLAAGYGDLIHPLDLANGCGNCHIGDNPYLADPNTILGQTVRRLYAPPDRNTLTMHFSFIGFGSGSWLNPPPLAVVNRSAFGDGGCMQCHDFAQTRGVPYCYEVLRPAAGHTMPPNWDPLGQHPVNLWPDSKGCFAAGTAALAPYYASMRKIRAMCTGKPVPDCP